MIPKKVTIRLKEVVGENLDIKSVTTAELSSNGAAGVNRVVLSNKTPLTTTTSSAIPFQDIRTLKAR